MLADDMIANSWPLGVQVSSLPAFLLVSSMYCCTVLPYRLWMMYPIQVRETGIVDATLHAHDTTLVQGEVGRHFCTCYRYLKRDTHYQQGATVVR